MKALLFTKDGIQFWVSIDKNGVELFSVAIQASETTLNYETNFVNEEKYVHWIKARTAELATEIAKQQIALINAGKLTLARVFSEEPFFVKADGTPEDMDINPQTGESLGRYSKSVLCTPERKLQIHRSFVEPTVVKPVTSEPENIKEPLKVE
jgi:hypothetical protein